MANITEVSRWENVIRQIENGEAATGGADGLANVQAKQLANRTNWLKANYLPLAGGVLWDGHVFVRQKTNNGRLVLRGGTDSGGVIELMGGEDETLTGAEEVIRGANILRAENGTNKSAIYIFPDGRIIHQAIRDKVSYDLSGSAIVAKSFSTNGYIKYASGLIVQWGFINDALQVKSATFPIAYPTKVLTIQITPSHNREFTEVFGAWVKTESLTGFEVTSNGGFGVKWFTIGY